MSLIVYHKITKVIKKNSIEYLCENHDGKTVSYPTMKSLQDDHPNLDELLITKSDLRSIPDLQELVNEKSIPSMESHTRKLSENSN